MTLVELHPLPITLLNLPAAALQGQTGAPLTRPSINAPVTLTVLLCGGRSVPGPCPPPLDLLHNALSCIFHHAHTRGLTQGTCGDPNR